MITNYFRLLVYKTDNRPKRHRGRYTILGIVIGLILAYGGFFFLQNHNQQINQIKDDTLQIPKIVNQIPKTIPIPEPNIQVPKASDNNQIQYYDKLVKISVNPIDLEHQIHEQINSIREQNGLSPFRYDEKLASIARDHSQDMLVNNYFDHTSPTGETFLDRMSKAHYFCYGGENIEENYMDVGNLVNNIVMTWMNSPDHKKNILYNYGVEGIGVYIQGNDVAITEDFC